MVHLIFFSDCFVSMLLLISWVQSLEKKIYCKIYGLYEDKNSEEAD